MKWDTILSALIALATAPVFAVAHPLFAVFSVVGAATIIYVNMDYKVPGSKWKH